MASGADTHTYVSICMKVISKNQARGLILKFYLLEDLCYSYMKFFGTWKALHILYICNYSYES